MSCTCTRPRYQVGVYKTIGPLVLENVKMVGSLEVTWKLVVWST